MSSPHLEDAIGTVDGSNRSFSTSFAYQPGSLAVFINGQLKRQQDDDGWTEGPGGDEFTLKEAPLSNCVGGPEKVRVFYVDTASSTDVIEEISGSIEDVIDIVGSIEDYDDIVAALEEYDSVVATLEEYDDIEAILEDIDDIQATLIVCQ